MISLVIFNAILLLGIYSLIKYRVHKKYEHRHESQNVKALNLVLQYVALRNGDLSAVEKLEKLNEFDRACDKLASDYCDNDEFSGLENVTYINDISGRKKASIKQVGH